MTVNLRETSRAKGEPVALFLFRYGTEDTEFRAYTNSEYEVTVGLITYSPVPITYGGVENSGTLDKKSLEVRTTLDNDIANMWLVSPPTYPVTLTIYRGHLNDPDNEFLVEWAGRVLSCSRESPEAVFSCEPISTSMRRVGLRRNWQYSCPHVLYGPQCNANKARATSTQTCINVNAGSLVFNDGWSLSGYTAAPQPAIKALGGLVTWIGPNGRITRTIIDVSVDETEITLNGPTTGLENGDTVEVSLGCNHIFVLNLDDDGNTLGLNEETDCQFVHANINNFGGQPWIPLDNPIGTNLNKYY